MNLGDGLLFELENGKPRLILLSHGKQKNPAKLSVRPRAANILSSRQPSCVEEIRGAERPHQQLAGRHREAKCRAGGAAISSSSNTITTEERSSILTSSKTHHLHEDSVKAAVKGKSNKPNLCTLGPPRANGKAGHPPNSGTRAGVKVGLKDEPVNGDRMVCLTNEQLQQILSTVQTSSSSSSSSQYTPGDQDAQGEKTDQKYVSLMNGEVKEEDGKGMMNGEGKERDGKGMMNGEGKERDGKGMMNGEGKERDGRGMTTRERGETAPSRSSAGKDNKLSGSFFSWLEDRQSESREVINERKARWRRELDEQVADKQQQQHEQGFAPDRLQGGEKAESVLSVQSSISHREQPAAIRSSLRLGEVTPVEEVLTLKRKEEQRRRWLEELDRQREETTERRKREKLLQSRTEEHDHRVRHFDPLQRRHAVQAAAPSALPPVQLSGSELGELEPWSSLSLVWDATSSCGAESVIGASVDSTSGFPARTSYLRTMTSLLDPAQIEERERRRLKQLEQQRVIEAQVEERRKRREQEEAKRRQEEEDEERRLAKERGMLQKQYELEVMKKRQEEQMVRQEQQPEKGHNDSEAQEAPASSITRLAEGLEDASRSDFLYKHTAVQTEATSPLQLEPDRVQTLDIAVKSHTPPPAAPPNSRSRAGKTGKENICLPPGGDPYEPFSRADRSRRDKRKPEWNTQRPNHRFVPASERYPAVQQKNRQESRLKRQAELLALQERTCVFKAEHLLPPPPPPPPPQHHDGLLCPNSLQTRTSPTRKVETGCGGHASTTITADRGRSPPIPTGRHIVQSQHASTSPPLHHPHPPALEFIPYVRTHEVFKLDPLEPADTPPPHTHSGAPSQGSACPPAPSHEDPLLNQQLLRIRPAQRQQEILRGLAQLRQSLLQKQRELETDLNPLLKCQDERQLPSTAHKTAGTPPR